MSILAAPTSTQNVALRQKPDVMSSLSPPLNLAFQFYQLVTSTTCMFLTRIHHAASLVVAALLLGSQSAAFTALLASNILAARTARVAKRLLWNLWDSKRSRRIRKKLEFEFFVLILGPGGNGLCLMLFWPGWLILGVGLFALLSGAR